MPVTSTNLIQGPATLYYAPFGSAEPASIGTAPAAPYVDLGGTNDGVTLNVSQDWAQLGVDQLVDTPESRRTGRTITIATNLAEATLANWAIALNNSAPTAGKLTLDEGGPLAFQPAYGAIILDGIAPGGFRRRFVGRKVLSTESVESAYKKDDQTLIPVTFTLHWVSSSIRLFDVTDATS
jgi:hypothetical protein